ncbi:MAG: hypothetical protein ACETWG_01670 [Candidatus Neomarinimicrobiota bacterium]
MSIHRISTYIAPFMKHLQRLLVLAGVAITVWPGCDYIGVEPSEEVPVLSNPQTSYDDRDNRFYAAVTVTLPDEGVELDTIWAEMFLATGLLADSLGTVSSLVKVALVDDATGGDILPLDGVYARKFNSPLPEGTGGSVRFEFYALIDGDTSNASDTLRLANLRPVILSVAAADTMQRPPGSFVAIDIVRATVTDPDGLQDIRSVSFTSLKPDSTLANQGQPINLADNGDEEGWGDEEAHDGIYSRIIQIDSSAVIGTYIYRFIAKDYAGAVSDTVTHDVAVIE